MAGIARSFAALPCAKHDAHVWPTCAHKPAPHSLGRAFTLYGTGAAVLNARLSPSGAEASVTSLPQQVDDGRPRVSKGRRERPIGLEAPGDSRERRVRVHARWRNPEHVGELQGDSPRNL